MALINRRLEYDAGLTQKRSDGVPDPHEPRPRLVLSWLCLASLLVLGSVRAGGTTEETNTPPTSVTAHVADTNAQEALRVVADLEGQVRASQLVLEQNGKEAREAAARQTELLSKGFQALNDAFAAQQQILAERSTQELQAIHSSNRVTALVGTTFAALAALAILTIAYFQWRMSKVWSELSLGLPAGRGFSGSSRPPVLSAGEPAVMPSSQVEDSTRRLLRSFEELEARVQGLERSAGSASRAIAPSETPSGAAEDPLHGSNGRRAEVTMCVVTDEQDRVAGSLNHGQALLKAGDWEAALKCYNEVLTIDPNHGEALVKKGVALERLKKLNEAFECYDRAIAADDSFTIAYLHKGGLCSRLERFKEALECYEKALTKHNDW